MSKDKINSLFNAFKIDASCVSQTNTGCIASFDLKVVPGTKISKIEKILPEIMLEIGSKIKPEVVISETSLKINAIVKNPDHLSLIKECRDVDTGLLPIHMGKSYYYEDIFFDLSKNPHTLIGGTTGSGKSSIINNIIYNLLKYSDATICIIDTKGIDFIHYQDKFIDKFNLASSFEEGLSLIDYLLDLMNLRFNAFKNKIYDHGMISSGEIKPIVFIIDEYADLISEDYNDSFKKSLLKLSSKCRAAGIYIIIGTQRPSAEILNGTIKSNFSGRIACKTSSALDSRIVIDSSGSEMLFGKGDFIINNYKYSMVKCQAFYSPSEEILSSFE